MPTTEEKKGEITIDVDFVIKRYNELNPEKRELDRSALAKIVDKHPQILSDWSRGKAPKLISVVKTLMELSQSSFDEIFKIK